MIQCLTCQPLLELGFVPLGLIDIGGTSYHPAYLDFGPGSVDGWLADGRKHIVYL